MSDKSHTFAFRIRSGQTIDHTVFLESANNDYFEIQLN